MYMALNTLLIFAYLNKTEVIECELFAALNLVV